jgi:hypothetical protein
MNHGTLLNELYGLITAVTEFANITGTNLGGMEPDPTLTALTPPACWVSFIGDSPKEPPGRIVLTTEAMTFMFMAFIYLPMAKQSDMIGSHLPLLLKVVQGVKGKESTANTGHRWAYAGQKLALANTNRMVYAQRYSITGVM